MKRIKNFFSIRNALIIGALVLVFPILIKGFNVLMFLFTVVSILAIPFIIFVIILVLIIIALIKKSGLNFKKGSKNENDGLSKYVGIEMGANNGKNSQIDNLERDIMKSIGNLKSIEAGKYASITDYMVEISRFETMVPELVKRYIEGADFVFANFSNVEGQITMIQEKISNETNQKVISILKNTLNEKNETLREIMNMQENIKEWESQLMLISSTLERIEAMIRTGELTNGLSDEETRNVNEQLAVFSECVKNVSKVNLQ